MPHKFSGQICVKDLSAAKKDYNDTLTPDSSSSQSLGLVHALSGQYLHGHLVK